MYILIMHINYKHKKLKSKLRHFCCRSQTIKSSSFGNKNTLEKKVGSYYGKMFNAEKTDTVP